jgi:AcrR family transcriptional regulator
MTGKPVRSDACENRRRIVEVARDAFSRAGDTSLNEIAKRAGVGSGTLYRHFPTRELLLTAGSDAALLRPEIDPDDFPLLISFLWRINPATGAEACAARMLDLVMEGLLARD